MQVSLEPFGIFDLRQDEKQNRKKGQCREVGQELEERRHALDLKKEAGQDVRWKERRDDRAGNREKLVLRQAGNEQSDTQRDDQVDARSSDEDERVSAHRHAKQNAADEERDPQSHHAETEIHGHFRQKDLRGTHRRNEHTALFCTNRPTGGKVTASAVLPPAF